MIGSRVPKGQPLVALMLLIGGWAAARAASWDAGRSYFPSAPPATELVAAAVGDVSFRPVARSVARGHPEKASSAAFPARSPVMALAPLSIAPGSRTLAAYRGPQVVVREHSQGLTGLLMPPQPVAPAPQSPVRSSLRRRWSGDAWLLMREGSAPVFGALPPTYGGSQTGGVLRFRFVPEDAHRTSLYLRATSALNGVDEKEVALGLSARPVAALPIVTASEMRATRQGNRLYLRPSVFAVTELPPFALGHGFSGEFYAQAGYVGGNSASGFVDGQLRVDRRVVRLGRAELHAGGGVWGGAQKGASRLDVGPGATLRVAGSESGAVRLGIDWRFRVAGDAAPSSGPALTVSAGF